MAEISSNEAMNAGIDRLSNAQILLLYHAMQTSDNKNNNKVLTDAIATRAESILEINADLGKDDNGKTVDAISYFYDDLDKEDKTQYKSAVQDTINVLNDNVRQAQDDITWYRENYAEARDSYEEAAKTFAKETGTEYQNFEEWTQNRKNEDYDNREIVKQVEELVKSNKLSDAAKEAGVKMLDIYTELEAHSIVGNDNIIQNAGMKAYDDKSVTSYRGSGTNGKVDDLEGIGEDNIGTGIGKGINGTGNGTGTGDGDGDGDKLAKAKASKSGDTDVDSVFAKTSITNNTIDDISSYIEAMSNEPQINHIFSNTFYNIPPVPEWAFSVDFIPCTKTITEFVNLDELKLLTRAIQTITANEKSVNIQKLNYLGLSHPFFTKMQQTHGDLNITFAENEEYQVTRLLVKLLKYGSFVPSFPTYEIVDIVDNAEMRQAVVNNDELIVTHAPSDTESPAYKLNAAVLNKNQMDEIPDDEFSKLFTTNKYLFDVVLKLYRASDTHAFGDIAENKPQYVYHYHKCWIKNLGSIDLNYDDDNPIDRTVILSYQYLTTSTYDEYLAKNLYTPKEMSQEEILDYIDNVEALNELEDLDVDIDDTTMNRSPANMTEKAAKDFVETYAANSQTNNMNGYSEYMNRKTTTKGR